GEGGELRGRGAGAAQVGGEDRVGAKRRQQPGGAARLVQPRRGELDVGGALEAALEVPRGLAVPPEDDPAVAALGRCGGGRNGRLRRHRAPSPPPRSEAGSESAPASSPAPYPPAASRSACSRSLPRVALASSGRS